MSLRALFARPAADMSLPLLPLHLSQSTIRRHTASTSPSPRPDSKMTGAVPQSDPLLAVSRQEAHLQSTLQILLDAQSEGLLDGLAAGSSSDGASTTGSRTPTIAEPTSNSNKPKSIVPVRQPTKKKVGLRGARRGITRAMSDLANLKNEEGRILEDEIAERQEILSTVSGFQLKSTGLREKIQGIQSEETSQRVERLKAEERTLGSSIHELENQLYEMQARHRHLIREIDGLSNSVQSKLSSYESALALTEKDVKRFLSRPPEETSRRATEGVWALPRERRTLEMAKDHYNEEHQTLKTRTEAVQAERTALVEGKTVWQEVVAEVNTVEKSLREEMQTMQSTLVQTGEDRNRQGMEQILQTMQIARTTIESKLDLAETNNWRLLVCCIGAELEALIEGQAVLEGALEASMAGGKSHSREDASQSNTGPNVAEGPLIDDSAPASSPHSTSLPAHDFLNRSEDEDDGPGPELLISQHE